MKMKAQNGHARLTRRPMFLGAVCFPVAIMTLCWWLNRHVVIRITNNAGSDMAVIVDARDGVVNTVKQTALLAAGQTEWLSVPCTGHCSYLLNVRFGDGRSFKTDERYASAWRIAFEKVGPGNSVFE